jgi:hypothetical protein
VGREAGQCRGFEEGFGLSGGDPFDTLDIRCAGGELNVVIGAGGTSLNE